MSEDQIKTLTIVRPDTTKLSQLMAAQFPKDLTSSTAAVEFARWCIAHQLEPVRDVVPYHGSPYITVEWFDRKASDDPAFKGYEYTVYRREQKENLAFNSRDLVAECRVSYVGLETPLIGLGVISYQERMAKSKFGDKEPDEVTGSGYRGPGDPHSPTADAFQAGTSGRSQAALSCAPAHPRGAELHQGSRGQVQGDCRAAGCRAGHRYRRRPAEQHAAHRRSAAHIDHWHARRAAAGQDDRPARGRDLRRGPGRQAVAGRHRLYPRSDRETHRPQGVDRSPGEAAVRKADPALADLKVLPEYFKVEDIPKDKVHAVANRLQDLADQA